MSRFEDRLKKAVDRGQRRSEEQEAEARAKALNKEELKSLHSKCRLQLSEQIEHCISKLADHFPGFHYETIYGERGWGGGISRDDVAVTRRGRSNVYSRLEMTIRPFSSLHVLELVAKGTIHNKEVFTRTHFERLDDADAKTFSELIDVWVLEFAELYAAKK